MFKHKTKKELQMCTDYYCRKKTHKFIIVVTQKKKKKKMKKKSKNKNKKNKKRRL